MKRLNLIHISAAKNELGKTGWDEIESLVEYLYANWSEEKDDEQWQKVLPTEGRIAPSIITRSESELFGVSMPRFSMRLFLRGVPGLINCRRVKTFKSQLASIPGGSWGMRDTKLKHGQRNPLIRKQLPHANINQLFSNPIVVADCLLIPPPRFSPLRYRYTLVELFKRYGEGNSRFSVPYVRTPEFGGGLCAQACCFIASAILNKYASGVFGLAEITALASDLGLKELLIGGLDETEMVKFFSAINLRATVQLCNPYRLKAKRDRELTTCLRAYVSSSMPVILFVDRSRLCGRGVAGQSFYYSNNLLPAIPEVPQPHAITAVGCNRKNYRQDPDELDEFIFHDSSGMPFMAASIAQLSQVGYAAEDVPQTMRHPTVLPITPKEVQMPLLTWMMDAPPQDLKYGLLDICHRFAGSVEMERELFLAKLKEYPLIKFLEAFPSFDPNEIVKKFEGLASDIRVHFSNFRDSHWIWFEVLKNRVNIWDAEIEPTGHPDAKDPTHYLLAIVEFGDRIVVKANPLNSKRKIKYSEGLEKDVAYQTKRGSNRLGLSLITSFNVFRSNRTVAALPPGVEDLEFYAFMRDDLATMFPPTAIRRGCAVSTMEYSFGQPKIVDFVADRLKKTFGKKRIVAFATFIPEILSHNTKLAERAEKALKFLIDLGAKIKSEGRAFIIEIVGGSRIHGIWRADTKEGPFFAVNRLDPDEALELLLPRLGRLSDHAAKYKDVVFGLELEPGPLFAVQNEDSIRSICKTLSGGHTAMNLKRCVGFNLDIPHWAFLAKIGLPFVHDKILRDRIVHAHISDHVTGHFCDNPVASFNNKAVFQQWVDFLKSVNGGMRIDGPPFSGFISCEMEACANTDLLMETVSNTAALI